jgi:hypothetical protein
VSPVAAARNVRGNVVADFQGHLKGRARIKEIGE